MSEIKCYNCGASINSETLSEIDNTCPYCGFIIYSSKNISVSTDKTAKNDKFKKIKNPVQRRGLNT